MTKCAIGFALAVACVLTVPSHASAVFGTAIDVNTNQDEVQSDAQCSLREAISAANNNNSGPGGDCTPGTGIDGVFLHATTYHLTLGPGGEDANAGGDLDVLSDMTISGVSAGSTTIDGQGLMDRVLQIASGKNVTIANVTIAHGHAPNGTAGPGFAGKNGGGIQTAGTLSLTNSVVTLNSAGDGVAGSAGFPPTQAGAGGSGGGIYNTGTLILTGSTVSSNVAGKGGDGPNVPTPAAAGIGGGAGGSGGGIGGAGALQTVESTISGNRAGSGGAGGENDLASSGTATPGNPAMGGAGGAGGSGGGVDGYSVTLARTTVAANSAGAGGPGGQGTGGPGGHGNPGDSGAMGGIGAGGPGGDGGRGGGVFANASMDATNVTVDSNVSGSGGAGGEGQGGTGGNAIPPSGSGGAGGAGAGGAGGPGGDGGGLVESEAGQLHVRYGTVSSNRAGAGGRGGSASGGNGGTGNPTHGQAGPATAGSAGAAGEGGGAAVPSGAQATIASTILAGNRPSNCSGAFGSASTNDVSFPADQPACPGTHGDPKLGPLGNHGGPTPTRLIGPGAALDAVPTSDPDCSGADPVQTDQRLLPRLVGAGCDAGAVEVRPARATTGRAKSVSGHGATVLGTVNPSGFATTYVFEYGTTTKYGLTSVPKSAGAGPSPVPVQAKLSKLKDGRIYHSRLVAVTADGPWPGADRTFKTPDATAPVIRALSLSHKTFTHKKGTKFRYRLSERARVVFTIRRVSDGHKVGSFKQQGKAGKNAKAFSGKIGKKQLSPGDYRATLVATDAAGNRSKAHTVSFTIVPG